MELKRYELAIVNILSMSNIDSIYLQSAQFVIKHFPTLKSFTGCLVASVVSDSVIHQASPTMGFSRQEYYSGLPCPPPRDLPDPGIKPTSLMSLALAGRLFTTRATWEFLLGGKRKATRTVSSEHA